MLFNQPLRFPKLKLPEMTSDDALLIASGPSFDDFRISDIEACPAVKYGCGQVFQFVHLDHYILIDPWLANMEEWTRSYITPDTTFPPDTQLWVTGPVHDACKGRSYHSRMQILGLEFWMTAAGPAALHFVIRHGHKRIFLLGLDGSFDSMGVIRGLTHAKKMIRFQVCERKPDYCDVVCFEEIYRSRMKFGKNLINLSTCSNYIDFLGVSEDIDKQPLGHIDRHSSLIAIDLPKDELMIKVAGHVAKFFVQRNPRQAVVVLTTDPGSVNLAKSEEAGFLTTNLSLEKISAGFSKVSQISL